MNLHKIEIFGSVYTKEFVVMSVRDVNGLVLDDLDKRQIDLLGFVTYRPLENNQSYALFTVDMDYKKNRWDIEYSDTRGSDTYSGIYIKLYDLILPYIRNSIINEVI